MMSTLIDVHVYVSVLLIKIMPGSKITILTFVSWNEVVMGVTFVVVVTSSITKTVDLSMDIEIIHVVDIVNCKVFTLPL